MHFDFSSLEATAGGCVVPLTMSNYQVWLFIGISLFSIHFQSTSAVLCPDDYFEAVGVCFKKDIKCPDGNIFFNGECYYITNNYCSSSELWINDKCCNIDCLKSCPNGYCIQCCNQLTSTVPPLVSENSKPPNTGCPNQPVNPYPVVPVDPILPISNCPSQPVTPYPVVAVDPIPPTSNCPNQPVTPYPLVPVNPIPPTSNCPNQPCCDQIHSCTQTTCVQDCIHNCHQRCLQPCKKSCCSTNCYNCGNNCIQQTLSTFCCQSSCSTNCCGITALPPVTPQPPVTPPPPVTPQPSITPQTPTSSQTPITPQTPIIPQTPITPQPPICPPPPICNQPPTTLLPPTIPPINPPFTALPPTTIPPPLPPPPDNITRCPPGTIQIGRSCHLIYCPPGSVIRDDRCVVIECPKGTVWTGHKCSLPEPTLQNLTFHNTVITNFNKSKPDIILNNTNNIVVNASMILQEESLDNDCYSDDSDCDSTPVPSLSLTTTIKPMNCCEVMTPRICEQRNHRWHCYSRRYRRCGDFCITPIIYLRPSRVHVRPKFVVMPPLQHDCHLSGNCAQFTGGFDCSGCGMGFMENCSYYCYRYSCPSQRCGFYDQEEYCSHYAGSYGCQEEDGCYDDWCQ